MAVTLPSARLLAVWACVLAIAVAVISDPRMDARLGWVVHVLFAVLALAPDGAREA